MKHTIKILMLCLMTSFGYAQKKLNKTSQSIKVNKDVVVDLNTNHVEIEIETWNKNTVEVEAYLESNKLSKEEMQRALKAWNLRVEGTTDRVVISSTGGRSLGLASEGDYAEILRDLEFELAEIPEIPEMPEMPMLPMIPEMSKFPEMPQMPEMPAMPELPELPKGIKSITFDYDRYQEEGEKYLAEWSKKYEREGGKELQESMEAWAKKFAESGYQEKMEKWGEEYGKRFDGKWAKDIEKWGEKFGEEYGEKMEKWGEEFGEKFGKEWEQKMEAWGERFENRMEQQAKAMEKRTEAMKERSIALEKRLEERSKDLKKRSEERSKRLRNQREKLRSNLAKRKNNEKMLLRNGLESSDNRLKKVIKIKIPKKAKLKTNIRHGELKITSVIYDMSGDVSHSVLEAEHIDGSSTSINVSYSPVAIKLWNTGTLNLNFVEDAQIINATDLVLNSKSSNISIENLKETGIIDGSFGDLTISNLSTDFKNLNLVLENSDALVNLPKNTDYILYFKGSRSKLNHKVVTQKTIRNYPEGKSSSKNIVVNAKYSDVVID